MAMQQHAGPDAEGGPVERSLEDDSERLHVGGVVVRGVLVHLFGNKLSGRARLAGGVINVIGQHLRDIAGDFARVEHWRRDVLAAQPPP